MNRAEIVAKLSEVGLVAVVRAESPEQAMKISEACIAGGIAGIEITFTVDGAVDIIKELSKKVDPNKAIIGAGGSLTAGAKTGDYESITRIAKEFIANIKAARAGK